MDLKKINWQDEFSIGNSSIDHDHKKIIEIYNRIVDEVAQGAKRDECARLLTEMTNYALTHFSKEEDYMKAFSYPKFEEHRRYHMEYVYEVSMFNVKFFSSGTVQPLLVLDFLKKWWIGHIQHVDQDYENYKKEIHSDAQYGKNLA